MSLSGKTAIVTGASRGIGRAIAVDLARRGAFVAINFRGNSEAALETQKLIEAQGGRSELLPFDVASEVSVQEAVSKFEKAQGRLDIVVNNAGIALDQLLLRVRSEDFERTFATNVAGAMWVAKAALRPMMKQRTGRIINISSVVAESGNPGQAVYSASKAAIIGMTKTLAREYASRGITVNVVAPGFIETDMTDALPPELRAELVKQTPLGRMGKPEDIAYAVSYLASDEASFVTGHVLRVNGGLYV